MLICGCFGVQEKLQDMLKAEFFAFSQCEVHIDHISFLQQTCQASQPYLLAFYLPNCACNVFFITLWFKWYSFLPISVRGCIGFILPQHHFIQEVTVFAEFSELFT